MTDDQNAIVQQPQLEKLFDLSGKFVRHAENYAEQVRMQGRHAPGSDTLRATSAYYEQLSDIAFDHHQAQYSLSELPATLAELEEGFTRAENPLPTGFGNWIKHTLKSLSPLVESLPEGGMIITFTDSNDPCIRPSPDAFMAKMDLDRLVRVVGELYPDAKANVEVTMYEDGRAFDTKTYKLPPQAAAKLNALFAEDAQVRHVAQAEIKEAAQKRLPELEKGGGRFLSELAKSEPVITGFER